METRYFRKVTLARELSSLWEVRSSSPTRREAIASLSIDSAPVATSSPIHVSPLSVCLFRESQTARRMC